MGCLSVSTKRVGELSVDTRRSGRLSVSCSMVCSVPRTEYEYYVLDWQDSYVLTETGEYLIGENEVRSYKDISSITEYLFRADYGSIDYRYAMWYFERLTPVVESSGCSSVRKGDLFGRNFDWFYDRSAEFVVTTRRGASRHATIGVCGMPELTDEFVRSGTGSNLYAILPFYLRDGINDAGVFCSIHVAPGDYGATAASIPLKSKQKRLCSIMVPRFVLDNFDSALKACEYIRDYVSVFSASNLSGIGYVVHYMIGDENSTYVLEIVGDSVVFYECDKFTNFYIHGVTFNEDGTVCTPADADDGHLPSLVNGITDNGCGLERYNLIVEREDGISDKGSMRSLMSDLFYTHCYKPQGTPWCTEFVGIDNLTVDSPASDYEDVRGRASERFNTRSRDTLPTEPRTWHTQHSSIYDIPGRKLSIVVQEDSEHEYEFPI